MTIRHLRHPKSDFLSVSLTALTVFAVSTAVAFGGEKEESQLPAFPGAEGFGAVATGGRGGRVIKVTNLNPSGPGSLQWACSQEGAKIIVFTVSGVITPANTHKGQNYLALRRDDITIAGQTAPGAGITIVGAVTTEYPDRTAEVREKVNRDYSRAGRDTNLENAVIRFIRIRSNGKCAISPSRARRIMGDHLSGSWGSDQCFNACSIQDFTYQWCANEETDPFLEGDEPHGFAMLNSYSPEGRLSLHHNFIVNHTGRSPCIDSTYRPDFINNVLYNVGFVECFMRWLYADKHPDRPFAQFNVIGNCYKDGPGGMLGISAERPPHTCSQQGFVPRGGCKYYFDGNRFAWEGYAGKDRYSGAMAKYLAEERWPTAPHDITIHTAEEACELVLAHGGCLPRDSVSARLVAEARTGTGSWGVHVPDGGLMEGLAPAKAPPDTDDDGMPDDWERARGLDPNDPSDHSKIVPAGASPGDRHKGYTYIEYYINELADLKIAEALTRARLDRDPAKPWDKPAEPALPHLLRALDQGSYPSLFAGFHAAQALAKIGPPAVPGLVKALRSGDPTTRMNAARALGWIGPDAQDAVPVLIERLKDDPDGVVRGRTAEALAKIAPQSAKAVAALAGGLADGYLDVRVSAAAALGACGPSSAAAIPALQRALTDERREVKRAAALALGKIGNAALAALKTALAGDDPFVRRYAARALADLGGGAVEVLMTALSDADAEVRREATWSLALLGSETKKAAGSLKKAQHNDPDYVVRYAAGAALRSK